MSEVRILPDQAGRGTAVHCPFYGASLIFLDLPTRGVSVEVFGAGDVTETRHLSLSPHLITQPGNRCALITSAHSPCAMESPDWSLCHRNPENNWSYGPLPPPETPA